MAGNGKRIVFTGGSGKAGRHCIPYLQKQGYQILNVDLTDFPDPSAGVFTLKADLTDSGQVFNALTSHYSFADYEGPNNASPPDAVIHFAAYARNMLVPVRPLNLAIRQICMLTLPRTTNATAAT
jgi:nucleoside-diphosphate-sugar epimerase